MRDEEAFMMKGVPDTKPPKEALDED